jgi:hypothetical protein
LDLFDGGLTVLAGPGGAAWRAAAAEVGAGTDAPLRAYVVGGPGGDLDDPEGRFAEVYGVGDEGAVLVRPDGYVAWRVADARDAQDAPDARAALREGLAAALGGQREVRVAA